MRIRNSLVDEILSLVAGDVVYFGEIIELADVNCTRQNRQHHIVLVMYALNSKK